MALTAAHILADIKNIATAGSNPIDFRIPDEQILFWIDEVRSMLIAQAIQKRQDTSDIWIQPISCLSLIEVDKSECCEITTDCMILRTSLTIPNTIETSGDNTILRVLKPNGVSVSKSNAFESKYVEYGKYTKDSSRWYMKNGYIYLSNEVYLETISIYGIFERPSDLADYTACDGSTCYTIDSNYPCSLKMAKDITTIILKERVYPYLQLPQDTANDASNTPNTPPNTKGL